jgi:glycosyltransferase involved in cell wall biosynthesis
MGAADPVAREADAPHVVMIVGNDVTVDNRVLKTAATLSRAGARVTIVGYSPTGLRTQSSLGAVDLVRVPVPFTLRETRHERRSRRRAFRLPVGYRSLQNETVARQRVQLLDRDPEHPHAWRIKAAVQSVRVRAALRRRSDGATRLAWKAWDKAWGGTTLFASWESVVPEADDYELAFGPVIDALEPDAIHAHDMHMLGVAARATARARAAGRRCTWVYDSHEWVAGLSQYGSRTKRIIAAWADHEAEFIRRADRVITVSPPLAGALQQRYDLPALPAVVLNIPPDDASAEAVLGIREVVGLDPSVPLAVYSGGVQAARGVQTAVAALPHMPEVHLAVVAVPHTRTTAVQRLAESARSLGVADRLHLLEPVPPHEVSSFLATADVGLIPLLHYGSHEMALTNKLFEYLHAGIPVVVSDCQAQAEFVREHGTGTVHRAEDPVDLARAVREALARNDELRAASSDEALLARYSWEGQEPTLVEVYAGLLGWDGHVPSDVPFAVAPETARVRTGPSVLGIGPANSAGQGWAWAKAVERNVPNVRCEVVAVVKEPYDYGRDVAVEPAVFARDIAWQGRMQSLALRDWSHALFEAGRPIFGTLNGRDFTGDAEVLRSAGVHVGLLFHGSEVRDPRRHAASHRWSPFRDPGDSLTLALQKKYDELAPRIAAFDGPMFVSTPDLLDYLPDAHWLPLVVDTTIWTPQPPPLEREVPVVVHAPSNTALKGTELVEAVLVPLAERGLVDYRRIQGVPPSKVGAMLADADVVIDQMRLEGYGVLACEGAALGRVVVGHLGDVVRSRVGGDVPILEASPDALGDVMERILDDRDSVRAIAAEGPGWVAECHDGRTAARVLHEHLLARD